MCVCVQGLEIVAFPCNQFGRQEPGSNAEIAEFVAGYGAEFLMMDKVDVNGADASPVWSYLKGACDTCGDDVGWNFGAKFVVDKVRSREEWQVRDRLRRPAARVGHVAR